ncbi:2-octaprenyl-3-methyl-6-methoxy-1,4-benzoquinol hydroxylase [Paracoccus haematequi]|uniref:2-octaprenyl-3-methyl-6-methoxy-1,4-benzoquinol hydroxylase n=1 Tax=Paracoccus haematequi TaxID=2491866 RepID=A0A3S4DU29_9RHOB|nr:UbiH/UbiF family hydroxylase [Paracoccus haematequi]VDS07283.1 2-octaprenyl-3-methyl-6-methoxy-1,4-benzoquinol hydroxylase [Paracoccus haematequi]
MIAGKVETTDILVSGGGIAGLITAAAFGAQGFSTLCVDPAPPVTEEGAEGADLRTTAFLTPSVALLGRIGLWDRLLPHATPLQIMRIVDAGGARPVARLTRDFDATEIGDQPFGWNLPNWLLRREISARLAGMQNVRFQPGTGTAAVAARDEGALVTLTDGRRIRARLLVGADGRDSPVRQALGIGVRTFRYGQKALAFAVTHDVPHGNVSTEIHRSGGPFTLVPLPDRDGQPCSAVVWMENGRETARLAALPPAAFEAELNARSAGVLGRLTLATRLTQWPIISQIADRFTGPRTALIAEAAHVVPPIGAQGLNMSLADLTALIDLSGDDPGSAASLAAYDRARRPEAFARLLGIDALNRASQASLRPLRDLRAAALGGLYGIAPVRRLMMRAGLGMR